MSLLALVTAMLIATTWASTWHSTGRAEKRAETHGSRLYSEKEILKAIAGTYSLINTTSARNGKPVPDAPNGKHPAGILIYLESGWMSALTTATVCKFAVVPRCACTHIIVSGTGVASCKIDISIQARR